MVLVHKRISSEYFERVEDKIAVTRVFWEDFLGCTDLFTLDALMSLEGLGNSGEARPVDWGGDDGSNSPW